MTDKKTEALKLALYVLNEVRSETFRLLRNGQTLYAEEKVWNAIFVIKQALEQPAQQEPAQQEPVAWMTHTDGFMPLFHKTRESALNWQTQPTPLYTSPQASKPWVGLTDEERAVIVEANTTDDHGYDIWCDGDGVARVVEAKLKEKNT